MDTPEKEVEKLIQFLAQNATWANKVYSVGGFVRDDVLGIPNKDLDIVVEANGGAKAFCYFIHELYPQQTSKPHNLGANYPIWHLSFKKDIILNNGHTFHVNGAELDVADSQIEMFPNETSRQRIAKFGSIKEDIKRRDFTTNMLLRDLTTGKLLDLTGTSLQDIKDGVLRGHPEVSLDKTFSDDPLRMIRLVRFHCKFGWSIPPDVLQKVRDNAHRINIVSGERIRDELIKIMLMGKLAIAIRLMDNTGLLPHILPEVVAMKGCTQGKDHHSEGDVYVHSLLVLEKTKPTITAQLGALFHDVGKPKTKDTFRNLATNEITKITFHEHEFKGSEITEEILRRLKFEIDVIDKIKKLVKNHMKAHFSDEWSSKAVRRFIRDCGEHLNDILDLSEIDALSALRPDGSTNNLVPALRERIKNLTELAPIKKGTVLNGMEIMALFNIKTGPQVGKILAILQDIEDDFAIKGEILTKEQAMIALKGIYET